MCDLTQMNAKEPNQQQMLEGTQDKSNLSTTFYQTLENINDFRFAKIMKKN